jgi:hypothetical protein
VNLKEITLAATVFVFSTDVNSALITDTVTVDGWEWAQPDLFSELSWQDIADVCGTAYLCENQELNGYDMTGWQWAYAEQVDALINIYLQSAGLSGDDLMSGFDFYIDAEPPGTSASDSTFDDFFALSSEVPYASQHGFRQTVPSNGYITGGITRSEYGFDLAAGAYVSSTFFSGNTPSGEPAFDEQAWRGEASTDQRVDKNTSGTGAWLVRTPSEVPEPSTIWLLGSGLIGLIGFGKRRSRITD